MVFVGVAKARRSIGKRKENGPGRARGVGGKAGSGVYAHSALQENKVYKIKLEMIQFFEVVDLYVANLILYTLLNIFPLAQLEVQVKQVG